jgi:exosortase/archaeosortase family protein
VGEESYDQFVARTEGPRPGRPLVVVALLFMLLFGAMEVAYDAFRGSAFEHWVIGDLTVRPTAWLLNAITPEVGVQAIGNQLRAPGGGLVVKKGCEGVEIMFMLIAAFGAVSLPWKRKALGLGLGVVFVFAINQVRLIALFYAYRYDGELFNLLHGTVTPVVLVLLVALYCLAWFGAGSGRHAGQAPEDSGPDDAGTKPSLA